VVEKIAYTLKELVEATGLSYTTLWRDRRDGKLRSVKPRGRILIPAEAVREYLSGKEEARDQVKFSQDAA
jgi:excisionase family DNA binding protein